MPNYGIDMRSHILQLMCVALGAVGVAAAGRDTGTQSTPTTESPAADATHDVDLPRQIAALSGAFRRSRGHPRRCADTLRRLTALGPPGVTAAKRLVDSKLKRFRTALEAPSPTASVDEEITKLRDVLGKLRAQEVLSKQKLKKTGLPALDRLTILYRHRQPQFLRHYAKLTRVRSQLEKFAEMLGLLGSPGQATSLLPMQQYLLEVEQLRAKTLDSEHEAAMEVVTKNATLARQLDPKVYEGMRGLNEMRIMCGLHPLAIDLKLCQAAKEHSADMRSHKFFSHTSPLRGKRTFQDRAGKAGTTASGENIYMGRASPISAVKGWFLSPGHHKNMLHEGHRRQGLGRAGKHWTHMFGR